MTPFELRSLCESSITPLAFAQAFRELTEANRKQLSTTAQEIFGHAREGELEDRGMPSHKGGLARLAILACCAWSQAQRVKGKGWRGMFPREGSWMEALQKILLARRPTWADDWIALQLDDPEARSQWQQPARWNTLRELIQAGVIRRPMAEGYTRLFAQGGWQQFDPVRDADLLETEIWQLFAVDTMAFDFLPEISKVPSVPAQQDGAAIVNGPSPISRHGWPPRLYELANAGKIDRGRLIDATLSGLRRDVRRTMRIGLLRFLAGLAPTDDEIAAREPTFRELLRHDQELVVATALDALRQLQESKRLEIALFLEAVPPALAVLDKASLKKTLSLIDWTTKNSAEELPAAVRAVAVALNHESTEIQDHTVKLLTKWKAKNPSLDLTTALQSATALAAYNRRQLEDLAGNQRAEAPAEENGTARSDLDQRRHSILQRLVVLPAWLCAATCLDGLDRAVQDGSLPPAFNPDPAVCPVLSGVEAIEPIEAVDDLIDAVARLFQVIDGPEELERIVDGIMRLGGKTTSDFEAKTAGLCQTKFGVPWRDWSPPTLLWWSVPSLVRLIVRWLGREIQSARPPSPALGFEGFDQRIDMLLTRFRSRQFGPVLATPTHRGGWIDPRVFVGRLKAQDNFPWIVHRFDLIAGLVRLAPDFRREALDSAADLPNPYGPIVRYALGGAERPTEAEQDRADEWLAAGRTRHPRGSLDDLRILGLNENEPDGIARAVYRFVPGIDLAEYAEKRYSIRDEPPCVRVAPTSVPAASLPTRPTVALAACALRADDLRISQSWEAQLPASFWPANPDATLAIACCKLVTLMDSSASFGEAVPAWMSPLQIVDRGWSEMARTALWLGAVSLGPEPRGAAVDALIEGIADGRARPGTLAQTLLHIASGGWMKLNRLADSLREVTRTSLLAERVAAEILDRLIVSWQGLPRDAHHLLALQVGLLSNLRQAPSPAASDALAKVTGSGKAAKLARQLRALESRPGSAPLQTAALEAAEGRLARAERILQFVERHR